MDNLQSSKMADGKQLTLSIVIPVFDESKNVSILADKLRSVLTRVQLEDYEIIFVDDGSKDGTTEILTDLSANDKKIISYGFSRNMGKTAALSLGFKKAIGRIIITMDGDLQDDPEEIPRFLEEIKTADVVTGWKKKRKDPLEKKIPSLIFNKMTTLATGLKLKDTNSGFKAYKRWCVEDLELTGNLYRFIPALAFQKGAVINEIPVNHKKREHGKSKYGFQRYFIGAADLFTILFITRFTQKPLYFFCLLSLPLFILGSALICYLSFQHFYHYMYLGLPEYMLQSRPLLILGFFFFGTGIMIFLNGILAEFILKVSRLSNITPHSKKLSRRNK